MRIVASSSYLPQNKMTNKELAIKFNVDEEYIEKRTGIKQRYYSKEEKIEEMALKAVTKLVHKTQLKTEKIGAIIVATTSTKKLMPGISNYIQKELHINKCICLDILAGCSGYINAVDIAQMYIDTNKVEKAIVVGVEKLSEYTNSEDIGTAIILADGAGATLFGKAENKMYASNIQSIGQNGDILTCLENQNIQMDGKKVYKFATTKVSNNIKELLSSTNLEISQIKYIVPHQSNLKILKSIEEKIGATPEQMYINISKVGNTFNASIPIALDEIIKKSLLKENDKIIIAGYGGGLNLGSILIEI